MHTVQAWQETITIPTYPVGEPERHPLFLEKRVYQGSSGVVYPHPVIDKVYDEKEDREYTALFLENRYLKIMILPELGGRVQMALDKTNGYHFVYYNQVIKPALVGLAGPWISGGIEFNWPQHHRPSTFDPVDFTIQQHDDGSKTVWCGEIEKMFHTKGMAGFTLYPDTAYLEIKGQLYNRTPLPQTFLWWANPAVHVDEHYQSVFPPDVTAVYDHGKRDVSSFPIATGTYYKVDYSPGTDISRYKNIPVPTSYMAVNSDFDFIGGYHHKKEAGILHVANHHIAPGKKQWTWGSGAFGQAWDRHLTDEDGPYFELMTGVFTDNQPDFSWIMPREERLFTQYFMPYKEIGYVKNASKEVALNLEIKEGKAHVGVYVTAPRQELQIRLESGGEIFIEEKVDLRPEAAFRKSVTVPAGISREEFTLRVMSRDGRELLSYTPVVADREAIPEPAKPIPAPQEVHTIEGLYLAGLHLEQYRHATFSPVDYWEEALRRDLTNIRCNRALGRWHLRRGHFAKAEAYLRRAIAKQLRYNPNPYDGETFYLLGLTGCFQGNLEEAYAAFYKATWNAAWEDAAFFELARLECRKGNYSKALALTERSLRRNYYGYQARHLKATLLRRLGRREEALAWTDETMASDPLDFGARYERVKALEALDKKEESARAAVELKELMRDHPHTYIEIAIDYLWPGFWEEVTDLLKAVADNPSDPLPHYYLAYVCDEQKQPDEAKRRAEAGFRLGPDRVFPNRLEDMLVLEKMRKLLPSDYKALYYLGNFWYDKRQYDEAIDCWEKAAVMEAPIPTVYRNLGIAYFNKRKDPATARQYYERAYAMAPGDARLLLELDQLYKRLNRPPEKRFAFLSERRHLVEERDDLYLEYVTLANLTGRLDLAAELLAARHFHPWEGGEGKVSGQFLYNQVARARRAICEGCYDKAVDLLEATETYPRNLGEGKIFGARENDIHYWLGCAYEGKEAMDKARRYWEKAAAGDYEPTQALYYNDQSPDKIFYQGLALRKLGDEKNAKVCFQRLVDYGAAHLDDEVEIDYFAVSLPELMTFDDDLEKRNRIHCHYLQGLGCLGLGDKKGARRHLEAALAMDRAHVGVRAHWGMVE